MKRIITILLLLILVSCKKDAITPIQSTITKPKPQLAFDFDSLRIATGYEIGSGPMVIDYDNNGRYDLVVNRRNMSRTQTTYTYEMLNPIVILDNGTIKEITNLWKGGSTSAVGDFNGDGYEDIAVMDNGPEYWDLNPNPTKTPLTVYWNSKQSFTGASTIVTPLTNGCFNIGVLDSDKNGKYELMPMGIDGGDFKYQFNGTSFDKTEIIGIPNISGSPTLFDDFDKNGTLDVFSFGFSNGKRMEFAVPALITDALTNPNIQYITIPTGYIINTAVMADFKGNGFKDIIFVCQNQGNGGTILEKKHYLFYYENLGNGKFVLNTTKLPEYIIPNSGYPMQYMAKDYDGDGDIDFYNMNLKFKVLFLNNKGIFTNGL